MRSVQRVRARRPACLRSLVFLGLAVGLCASGTAAASSFVTLTPFGTHGANPGINEHWVQVESNCTYSSCAPPTWQGPDYNASGTTDTELSGISSIGDAQAALALNPGDPGYVASVSGTYAGPINYGNAYWNTDKNGGGAYGTSPLVPLFNSSTPTGSQINYAGELSGYVYLSAGLYNFSVLTDDGMQFTLSGANGNSQTMSLNGLNSHASRDFSSNVNASSSGLYKYDLIGYNRLQDGELRLLMGPADQPWNSTTGYPKLVPASDFFTSVAPVPLPAAGWLFGSGLIGLVGVARRRARRTGVAA